MSKEMADENQIRITLKQLHERKEAGGWEQYDEDGQESWELCLDHDAPKDVAPYIGYIALSEPTTVNGV